LGEEKAFSAKRIVRRHPWGGAGHGLTDEWPNYNTVGKNRRYARRRINRSAKVYVLGDVHTKLRRGILEV
jgi:hypothetical protein